MRKKLRWRQAPSTPPLAVDWSDDALVLAWRPSDAVQSIETARYALPPGWVVEGQIKAPEAMADLIRQALKEHDWPSAQAVMALGAPFLTHHWLEAQGDEAVPSTPVLRRLIDKVSPSNSSLDETAYLYDARRAPALISPTAQPSHQITGQPLTPIWWLVGLPQSVVASLEAMFRLCDLLLVRIDVRASVLFRLLLSKQVLQDKCCIIDQHGAFTEWWLIDQGQMSGLQSYSHARLSEAEQAHYLGERLASEVAKGSIASIWVSEPLSERMAHMLYQATGIIPQSCLDTTSHGTAITTGLLQ